ncbi:hypothetical protein DY000_02010593 [Brassica cretica]|uniref:Uncharacterized protein n=1 Tax=Brassica cretica TaxID=69181 RepID=A0ABQ7CCC5_BRACR|nr:hypothetical protein DY000_02010593 [Brassica cretica]
MARCSRFLVSSEIWKLVKYGGLIFRYVFRGVSGGDYSLPWLSWCLLDPPDRVLWSDFSCYMNDLSSIWVGANYICIGARSMRLVCLKVMVDFYFRWKAGVFGDGIVWLAIGGSDRSEETRLGVLGFESGECRRAG